MKSNKYESFRSRDFYAFRKEKEAELEKAVAKNPNNALLKKELEEIKTSWDYKKGYKEKTDLQIEKILQKEKRAKGKKDYARFIKSKNAIEFNFPSFMTRSISIGWGFVFKELVFLVHKAEEIDQKLLDAKNLMQKVLKQSKWTVTEGAYSSPTLPRARIMTIQEWINKHEYLDIEIYINGLHYDLKTKSAYLDTEDILKCYGIKKKDYYKYEVQDETYGCNRYSSWDNLIAVDGIRVTIEEKSKEYLAYDLQEDIQRYERWINEGNTEERISFFRKKLVELKNKCDKHGISYYNEEEGEE